MFGFLMKISGLGVFVKIIFILHLSLKQLKTGSQLSKAPKFGEHRKIFKFFYFFHAI